MKRILGLVILVITVTTGMQAYWNYKNYVTNKQQYQNEIQQSLDGAVNMYFESLAKQNTLGFAVDEKNQKGFLKKDGAFDKILDEMKIDEHGFHLIDSLDTHTLDGITIISNKTIDTFKTSKSETKHFNLSNKDEKKQWLTFTDSLKKTNNKPLEFLTSKVIISITNDTLDLKKLNKNIAENLKTKHIELDYALKYKPRIGDTQYINQTNVKPEYLSLNTKSLLLDTSDELNLYYKDSSFIILKRIIGGIIISILLLLSLIFCLIYLLKTISKQKQVAEIKNDLISNITHEFKTPISTITVALETLKNSDINQDKNRTQRYLDISTSQLDKLTIMVEKLLETATLDSKSLNLNKAEINLNKMLSLLVSKHQLQTEDKHIELVTESKNTSIIADEFHIENAINNIIDNAIKYGGELINITLNQDQSQTYITISDNGTSLTKTQSEQIFDKFYRVPKGNTHNVKGFGIGLYYTKKIIEKHQGNISVHLYNNTTFKITLPNAN